MVKLSGNHEIFGFVIFLDSSTSLALIYNRRVPYSKRAPGNIFAATLEYFFHITNIYSGPLKQYALC
jgi:hypothetical protein